MRINAILIPLLAALSVSAQAADMVWRSTPEVVSESSKEGGGHRHRGPASFFLRDSEGAEIVLWTPDLKEQPLKLQERGALLKPTGLDGYHLWLARRSGADSVDTAFRYLYVPGKPSGKSPADLLAIRKARLEIVPTPLPREHWRYESDEPAVFQVLFDGEPLAQSLVRLVTSNGSFVESVSDAEGWVRFVLPDDFSNVRPGRENNAPAEFITSVEHSAAGSRFRTTLSGSYFVNPSYWQSGFAGFAALAAGFLVGMTVLRRLPEASV